jgi:hypothetical protein
MSRACRQPDGAGLSIGSPWVLLGRASRLILLLGTSACALVGALTTPPYVVLVFAPAFGLLVSLMATSIILGFREFAAARRVIVLAGAWGALLVPALAGIGVLAAGGAVIMFVLMVLGSVVAVSWITQTCGAPDRSSKPGTTDERAMDEDELRLFIGALPTSSLLREWHRTGERLRPGANPQQRITAIRLRTVLLEELSRRDPAGVDRWLSEGDEDAPDQYVRGDWSASP